MPDLNHLLDQIQERSDNFDRVQKDTADLELSLYSGQHDDRKILLKALQAVTELHKPSELYPAVLPGVIYCVSCWDGLTDEAYEYPCPTVRAVTDAMEAE